MQEKPSSFSIKHWSQDDQPREKLLYKGKAALSDAELAAILIGSGNRQESAVALCKRILASTDNNLSELGKLSIKQLMEFKGVGEAPFYPAPWAEDESISSLATETEARSIMERAGLEVVQWMTKVQESIEFFKRVLVKIEADGPPPIGIHLLMGDNAKAKLLNYIQNLSEDRLSVALGMACKK